MKNNLILDFIYDFKFDAMVIGVNVNGEIEFRKLEEFTWLDNEYITYQVNFGKNNIKVYDYGRDYYIVISYEEVK